MAAGYHSLGFHADRCDGHMSCMRVCPTAAIRVRRGHATMLEDRCIDCGECIAVCTRRAILPLTDTMADLSRFECTVAIPSPALYTQFNHDTMPETVLSALKQCGFDEAVPLSPACDAVTTAVELYLQDHQEQYPLISSFCPTVVSLVQVKYPDLVEQLLPILSPRELTARDAKANFAAATGVASERIGAVYITPCPAKMVSIVEHPGQERSHLDAAVSISDLYPPLATAVAKVGQGGRDQAGGETASGVSWAFLGGLPRTLPAENILSVAGLANVIRILDDVEKGKLRKYAFLECHACPEGCVSGSLAVENPYVARGKAIRLMNMLPESPAVEREEIERRFREGSFMMNVPLSGRPVRPLDEDISVAIVRMKERDKMLAGLPHIDCGACGAPTCWAFAEDVVLGQAQRADCVFLWQGEIARRITELESLCARMMGARKEASL